MDVGGQTHRTHCVMDALILPALEGDVGTIRSESPLDRRVVEIRVTPDGAEADPPEAVVSFGVRREGSGTAQEIACPYINAFASMDEYVRWAVVRNSHGGFSKDRFQIDLDHGTVTCPANNTVPITERADGSGVARFGRLCASCPLREACTTARAGRSVAINRYEPILQRAKAAQRTEDWKQRYRANRPIAERTVARFTRRWWGGRHARCRGVRRILTDVYSRAAALNLARIARLELDPMPHPA